MAFPIIGMPGVSAFLLSLLQDLDVVMKLDDYHTLPVNTELKEMKNLLRGFEYVVLDGERRRHLGDKGAERWMEDLKDLFYDIEDLLDEIKMEKLQLQREIAGQPSSSQVRYNFHDRFLTVENIKNRLEQVLCILRERTEEADRLQLKRDVVQHNDIWLASQAKVRTKTGCFADESLIHGREEDKSEIIEMLMAEIGEKSQRKYEFVCVVGIGGLGKTTLAQLVFQDESVNRFFAVTSWACVSDDFDVIKVIRDLIESAAEKGGGTAKMPSGLPALQARLKKIISNQKFLIVLDDVWSANVLKELIGPLSFGAKGSKILVTTREDLGKKKSYHLGLLKDAECLKIFKDNAFGEGDGIDNDEDLMKMSEEIVRKCKGVPLVAKVIGSLLNGEDEEKWKAVKDNDLWNMAFNDEGLHPGLRLSYFYLPPFLKRCFEYFALFPSDYYFDQDDIVRMWMAEGLIEVKEGTDLEKTGDEYYNDLKGRSFIQEDNRMHDMVHHLACIVSGNSFFCGSRGSSSSTSSLQCVRHAFIHDKPEALIDATKLRTLVHNRGLCPELLSCKCRVFKADRSECDFSVLQSSLGCDLKYLRYLQFTNASGNCDLSDSICTLTNLLVLDLSYCSNLKNLPQDIGNLSNLRFLILPGTAITRLPDSVSLLSNLRVLNLSSCCSLTNFGNRTLSDSMCTLTNLLVLDLSFCENLKNLPQDIGKLSNLRFLKLVQTAITGLPDSVCSLSNLRVLDLDSCESLTTLPKDVGNLQSLQELILSDSSVASFPESIVNAKNLRLLRTSDPLTQPAHMGKLSKLEKLDYYRVGKEIGQGIDQLKGMNKLEGYLKILNMENIECAEEALIANLKSKKHIEGLTFIWNDFDAALTGRDGELEVRVLEALEPNAAIKSLSFENYVGHQFPSWMSTSPLLNLSKLCLTNLPELTRMELRSLQELRLSKCPSLREVSMTMVKLKTLSITQCKKLKPASLILPLLWDALESLVCDYYYLDQFVQLLKSTNASECAKLKHLRVSIGGDKGITSLPIGWPSILTSVEYLVLEDLPPTNFKILSQDDEETSCVAPSLVSIRGLYIRHCPVLVSLESLELPPRLEGFKLEKCPNLRNLPFGLRDITSLQNVRVRDCPVLDTLPA